MTSGAGRPGARVAWAAALALVGIAQGRALAQDTPAPGTARPTIAMSGESCGTSCTAHSVETTGLPAIDATGELVAFAYRAEDGGRGNPNLTIRIRDVRRDRIVQELPILAAAEVDDVPCDEIRRAIEERIDRAHSQLRQRTWRALEPLEIRPDRPAQGAHDAASLELQRMSAHHGALEITLHEPRLVIREPGVRVRFARSYPRWSAPRRECARAPLAVIEGAWIDVATRTLLIDVGHRAADLCDADGEEHAIRLPRGVI